MKSRNIKKMVGVTLGAVLAVSAVCAFAACESVDTDEGNIAEFSSSDIVVSTSGDSVNVNVNVDMQGAYDLFHNHVYTSMPMSGAEPTCTKDGYGYYTCECGAQYSDVIPALGHDLYITEDGLYRCSTCGIIFSVVNDDGHEYSSDAIYVPASDEEDAKWVTYCIDSDCKYIKELDESDLSGYTRVVTAAEAFGDIEQPGKTSYGQSASDSYRVVESGKYVVKKDIEASLKIAKGANVEIDLCGKSISPDSATHTVFVLPAAELTIYDSSASKSGTMYAGELGAAIYNKEGDVVISSGKIAREGKEVEITEESGDDEETGDVDYDGRIFGVIENKGEMTIESEVTVSATYVERGTYTWTENTFDEDGNQIFDASGNPVKQEFSEGYEETKLLSDRPLIVNGYIDDKTCDEYMGRDVDTYLELNGGTYNGGTFIENEVLASLKISGNGKFTCSSGCVKSYGDLTISGGRFSAVNSDANIIEICADAASASILEEKDTAPEIRVEGGTFYDTLNGASFAVAETDGVSTGANISITGGVFNGKFSLDNIESGTYAFASLVIYAGEFAKWPGNADDEKYEYEFLASGSAVEKDSDGIYTVQVQAADHVHSYEAVAWDWAGDGLSCEVTLTCNTRFCCEKIVGPIEADIGSQTEKIDATCAHGEITVYTATLTYGGETFVGTYEIENENTKLAHAYTEETISASWTYTDLFAVILTSNAEMVFVCSECGEIEYWESDNVSTSSTKINDAYVVTVTAGDGKTYWCSSEDRKTLYDWGVVVDDQYISHSTYFSGDYGNT